MTSCFLRDSAPLAGRVLLVVVVPFSRGIADTIARELAILALREQGMAWRQALKQVTNGRFQVPSAKSEA